MANFIATQFPNYHFILESTGQERLDFLNKIVSFYQDLNSKGYPVLMASVKGTSDTAYVELAQKSGDSLANLIENQVINSTEARHIFNRITDKVRQINKNEGMTTIFNQNYFNVLYNKDNDEFYFTNLVHNSNVLRKTPLKISPEYHADLQVKYEKELQELEDEFKKSHGMV